MAIDIRGLAPLLEVFDMPASIHFYRDVLGFEVVSTSGPGDSVILGCADVDGAYRHLRALGLDVKEPAIRSYGMKQLYVYDPDGYSLCFQWPATQETYDRWRRWYRLGSENEGGVVSGRSL